MQSACAEIPSALPAGRERTDRAVREELPRSCQGIVTHQKL